ncbi:McrB family protein [Azospirillum sp. ST 5-10]|uniref:McrB family protein n=1 Tax=unclassified Azospirillum TaxID=2630922 RepID=UPI003F49D227
MDEVANIGLGRSVNVSGASGDPDVIDALWRVKTLSLPDDPRQRAERLDRAFDEVMGKVYPKHNVRRPSARLVRIFAVLFPRDVLCLLDDRRSQAVRRYLGMPATRGMGLVGNHVLIRDHLRRMLGPEPDAATAIRYSMFTWFLWEHVIEPGGDTVAADAPLAAALPAPEPVATARPHVVLLPPAQQRKGMFTVADNLSLLLAIVRAAEAGAGRDELLAAIATEAPQLNGNSQAQVLSQAVTLGLLTVDNGTYRPTEGGLALLEGQNPANVLAKVFLRNIFGFAILIDELRHADGPVTKTAAMKALRRCWSNWTTNQMPSMLIKWAIRLGLVAVVSGGIQLTEEGEYWASGLPNDEAARAAMRAASPADDEPGAVGPAAAASGEDEGEDEPAPALPPVDAILQRFADDPALRSLVFSPDQIRLFHAALTALEGKRFVLLAGLSGTGKTSLARAYARACCDIMGLRAEAHYQETAVLPDWTDPTGLLGFVNPLANPPAYQVTETLRFLLSAHGRRDLPFFLCLDEMNLARVEHYFAPFLSAMEGRSTRLSIHAAGDVVENVPTTIPWPRNLVIVGTVNMDETTHPFSDKVLDRAFTFEFWDVDLAGWRKRALENGNDPALVGTVANALEELYAALFPARRHFGYRTCDEVLAFCRAFDGPDPAVALDAAVLAKVLPKIRGDDGGELPKALRNAKAVCADHNLTASADRLARMAEQLGTQGVVRFWS